MIIDRQYEYDASTQNETAGQRMRWPAVAPASAKKRRPEKIVT